MQSRPDILLNKAFVFGALIGAATLAGCAATTSATGGHVLKNYYPDANYDVAEAASIGAAGGALVGAFTNAYSASLSIFQPAQQMTPSALAALYFKTCGRNAIECITAAALGYLLVVNSDNHKMNFGQHMAASTTGAGILLLFLPILRGLFSLCIDVRLPRYIPPQPAAAQVPAIPPSTQPADITVVPAAVVAPELGPQTISNPNNHQAEIIATTATDTAIEIIESTNNSDASKIQSTETPAERKQDELTEQQNASCRIM